MVVEIGKLTGLERRLTDENKRLMAGVRGIIERYEDGQNHDAGAFDANCETCRILRDLRALTEKK